MANAEPNTAVPTAAAPAPRPAPPSNLRLVPAALGAPRALGALDLGRSTLNVMEGQPGGWGSVVLGTGLRAGLIGGGFYLAGERRWKQLIVGSLAASALVTVFLFAGHAVLNRVTR